MSTQHIATTRERPRDRKHHIEVAAAQTFAARGYHATGMNDIADAVGISAPALYRHFPNKYALFVHACSATAQPLLDATEPDPHTSHTPAELIDSMLAAVALTTWHTRTYGAIYRWEGRYLEPADRQHLTDMFRTLRRRLQLPLQQLRPDVTDADAELLSLGALSVIASLTAYRTTMPQRALLTLLTRAARHVLDTDLAVEFPAPPEPADDRQTEDGTEAARRERLIRAAIDLFARRGYSVTTIEDIATAVDLTPSGVYRHFPGKSDLLVAAFERATLALEGAAGRARVQATSPDDALAALCSVFVDFAVDNRALMRVYFSELGSLELVEQRRIRAAQRAHIIDWVTLLRTARPELHEREAVALTQAAISVATDQVAVTREITPHDRLRFTAIMTRVLSS